MILLRKVEVFLRKTGMDPTHFGRESVRDPRLVFDLRKGREPGSRMMKRLEHFMNIYQDGVAGMTQEKETSYRRAYPRPRIAASAPLTTPKRSQTQQQPRAKAGPRDPQARLIRQLLELAGPGASLHIASERPWASATFVGIQHGLTLHLQEKEDDDADTCASRLADMLPEAEFHIPGHIVADAVIDAIETICSPQGKRSIIRLTVLTIEDW